MEIGPWRCFQTTQKGNAVVCFPWLWNPDLHHDLRHSLYVFTVLMIVSRTKKVVIDERASRQTMWNPKEIPTTTIVSIISQILKEHLLISDLSMSMSVEHCSKNQRKGVWSVTYYDLRCVSQIESILSACY